MPPRRSRGRRPARGLPGGANTRRYRLAALLVAPPAALGYAAVVPSTVALLTAAAAFGGLACARYRAESHPFPYLAVAAASAFTLGGQAAWHLGTQVPQELRLLAGIAVLAGAISLWIETNGHADSTSVLHDSAAGSAESVRAPDAAGSHREQREV